MSKSTTPSGSELSVSDYSLTGANTHQATATGHDFLQALIGNAVADVKADSELDHILQILCAFEKNHGPTFNWIMPFATQAITPQRSMVKT